LLDPSELDEVFTKNNITVAAFSSALFAQLAELLSEIFRNLRYFQKPRASPMWPGSWSPA
jgi:hypothetical protein